MKQARPQFNGSFNVRRHPLALQTKMLFRAAHNAKKYYEDYAVRLAHLKEITDEPEIPLDTNRPIS